jgi:thiosulfate/3-mercaptopyruvate sulfurtransferase
MKHIVDADWLYNNYKNDNITIIDCRFDLEDKEYGLKQYNTSHIPGAYFIDFEKELTGKIKKHGGRHPLPDVDKLINKLIMIGISKYNPVIVYDDGNLAGASRLWFTLRYLGIDNVFVLKDGFRSWLECGYEISTRPTTEFKIGNFDLKVKKSTVYDKSKMMESIDKDDAIIIDSRSPERYMGEVEPIDILAGHIPGAVNHFWQSNFVVEDDDFFLKSIEEIEESFQYIPKKKKIIIHCGSGVTACVNYLLLTELDYEPKLYVGSWSDWISYDDTPKVLGVESK